jgi:hypothetical protein
MPGVTLSGGSLLDRAKRGCKNLDQPARSHYVRVAGLDALRLTAQPRVGPTNRLPDSHRGARGHTLAVPLCVAGPSETPHRERPGKKISRRSRGAKRTKGTRYRFFGPTSSRVDETPVLSSMWPIALATANGWSAAACRPPVVGWGSLRRKNSSPFYMVDWMRGRYCVLFFLQSSYRGFPF